MINQLWKSYKHEAKRIHMSFDIFSRAIEKAIATKEDRAAALELMMTFIPEEYDEVKFTRFLLARGIENNSKLPDAPKIGKQIKVNNG